MAVHSWGFGRRARRRDCFVRSADSTAADQEIRCRRDVATVRFSRKLRQDPGGGPESRLWDAVVEQGQEPERLD